MALRLMADSLIFTTIQVVWVTRNGETPATKQMEATAGDTQVYSLDLDMELDMEPLSQGDTLTCRATTSIGQAETSVMVKLEQEEEWGHFQDDFDFEDLEFDENDDVLTSVVKAANENIDTMSAWFATVNGDTEAEDVEDNRPECEYPSSEEDVKMLTKYNKVSLPCKAPIRGLVSSAITVTILHDSSYCLRFLLILFCIKTVL